MIKKAKIENKMYDVVSFEEYVNTKEGLPQNTAIEENGVLYPLRNKTDTAPGYYDYGVVGKFVQPTEANGDKYKADNIINFDNVDSLKGIIEKQDQLRKMEREILTSPDNIFTPSIKDSDTPEMKGLKEAVIAKHIDLDKYQHRFGSNYCNDRRILFKSDITLAMMKRMFNALDMKGTLIIEDKEGDIANPIGRKIVIDLTERGE